MTSPIKLNLGCGGRPLAGYVNIDQDTLEQMRVRYPGTEFPDGVVVEQYDIFGLPFADGTVDEVRADAMLEHLSFADEPRCLREVARVLKPGGVFHFSVPDFEALVRQWLDAPDDWQDFYRNDDEAIRTQHWFGTYTYAPTNRWGYLMASFFGSQNGDGQFHRNAYTEQKIRKMLAQLAFSEPTIARFQWKGDRDWMLGVSAMRL